MPARSRDTHQSRVLTNKIARVIENGSRHAAPARDNGEEDRRRCEAAAQVDPGGDKKLHPDGKPREPQPACVPGVNSGKAVLVGGKLWLALRRGTRL
jgi:hypothetical protein